MQGEYHRELCDRVSENGYLSRTENLDSDDK